MEQFKKNKTTKIIPGRWCTPTPTINNFTSTFCRQWNSKHIPQCIRSLFLKNFFLLYNPSHFG